LEAESSEWRAAYRRTRSRWVCSRPSETVLLTVCHESA